MAGARTRLNSGLTRLAADGRSTAAAVRSPLAGSARWLQAPENPVARIRRPGRGITVATPHIAFLAKCVAFARAVRLTRGCSGLALCARR